MRASACVDIAARTVLHYIEIDWSNAVTLPISPETLSSLTIYS